MRDVTDNATGELDVEVKRGRGRPRKADALTNAQRQAAYRARKRNAVTVTENTPAPRLEVDVLHAELAVAHKMIDELQAQVGRLQDVRKRDRGQERQAKTGGGHAELMAERNQLQQQVAMLTDRADLLERQASAAAQSKSVTRNENPVSFAVMVELLTRASKASTRAERQAIFETSTWTDGVVRADTSDDQVHQVRVAINPASAKFVMTRS